MARAVFLDYCTGFALDTFARGPVWAHKVNYRCGTGHGVGFISGVHEGPQSLRPNNPVIFKPGMTITDEPASTRPTRSASALRTSWSASTWARTSTATGWALRL